MVNQGQIHVYPWHLCCNCGFFKELHLSTLAWENDAKIESNPLPLFVSGEKGTVAGWGRLSEGGQLPNILQYVSLKIIFLSTGKKCKLVSTIAAKSTFGNIALDLRNIYYIST